MLRSNSFAMQPATDRLRVYLEVGKARTFAVASDWPGLCRSGRDAPAALQALIDCGPRYARVLAGTGLGFKPPTDTALLAIVDRLPGTATTDFGAPDRTLPEDGEPIGTDELQRFELILQACWRAFDDAVHAAEGQALRRGPRGGGRDLQKLVGHVRDAEQAYLSSLGGRLEQKPGDETNQTLEATRQAVLASLARSVRGEIPAVGPRGGMRWAPRYFVRRLAWHALDHAWEIADRVEVG